MKDLSIIMQMTLKSWQKFLAIRSKYVLHFTKTAIHLQRVEREQCEKESFPQGINYIEMWPSRNTTQYTVYGILCTDLRVHFISRWCTLRIVLHLNLSYCFTLSPFN